MADLTVEKIRQSIRDRQLLHPKFVKSVKTYESFLELEQKALEFFREKHRLNTPPSSG